MDWSIFHCQVRQMKRDRNPFKKLIHLIHELISSWSWYNLNSDLVTMNDLFHFCCKIQAIFIHRRFKAINSKKKINHKNWYNRFEDFVIRCFFSSLFILVRVYFDKEWNNILILKLISSSISLPSHDWWHSQSYSNLFFVIRFVFLFYSILFFAIIRIA